MGVSRTQVVKFIRKGDKGDPGAKGEQGATLRGPQAWSDCATGYAFKAGGVGEQWKDVVLYNGNYYSCIKSHTKTASNYPGSTTANNNGYWQLGDKIELVATKILLATYALVKNMGVEAIDMKDSSGNVLFQAKDGVVTCKTGKFENIEVAGDSLFSGRLKGVTGSFKNLQCVDGDKNAGGIKFHKGHILFEGDVDVADYSPILGRFNRFYAANMWGNTCGSRSMCTAVIRGNKISYYVEGILEAPEEKTLLYHSANGGYYDVMCSNPSPTSAGFPVNLLLILNESGSYTYNLQMENSQKITVINTNNRNNNVYIYSQGRKVGWSGGEMADVVCVNPLTMQLPAQAYNVAGRGIFVGAFRDNDW